jgi:hypothetical protein
MDIHKIMVWALETQKAPDAQREKICCCSHYDTGEQVRHLFYMLIDLV